MPSGMFAGFKIVLLCIAGTVTLAVRTGATLRDSARRGESVPAVRAGLQESSLVEQLVAAEAALWNAWKTKDTTYYLRTMLPDAVFVSGGGVSSRDETIGQVERFHCSVESTTLDHPQARRLAADAAALVVHATVAYSCDGQAKSAAVWSSTVFVRTNDAWRIAVHQESTVLPLARASQ
jgi:uncharacterized protein (TIGR02246 family)